MKQNVKKERTIEKINTESKKISKQKQRKKYKKKEAKRNERKKYRKKEQTK